MKLDYFDCISPLPLDIVNVGSIKSPKLIDVAHISYYTYAQYIYYMRLSPEEYFETFYKDFDIDFDSILNMTKFDLVLRDDHFKQIILSALNFFFVESFVFHPEYNAFMSIKDVNGNQMAIGVVDKDNYSQVIDIILQRVHITPDENEIDDISKIKNKRGKKIYEKIHKNRKKFKKTKAQNPDLTFPNIISSVVAKSESTTWSNVWDITVFQLFDLFERLQINDSYSIASAQVAAWGDKENKFKLGLWTTNIYNKKDDTE